ncbi:hypothetical protein R6Q57_005050 [Mikania cordata]
MNFERAFQNSHENKDTWSSMAHGMPVPHENGIEDSRDSCATMNDGIEVVGDGNPAMAPRMPTDTHNGMVDNWDAWNATTESTFLQRNGIVQNDNNWRSVVSGNLPHSNGIGNSMNSRTPVTSEKHINQISNPIPVETQENQLENENWHDLIGMYTELLQERTCYTDGILENVTSTAPQPPVVHNNGNQSWVANMPKRNSHQKSNSNVHQNHASNQGSSSLSYFNASLTSMHGSQQTQRFPSNNLINNEHSPKDGFPITGQYYSPNSPPTLRSVAAASSINDSFSFAPITPENQKGHMNCRRLAENINFPVEEAQTSSKDMHDNQTVSIEDAESLYNELLQTIENSPPSAVSATERENIISEDKDGQDNVLNKTPNQKTPTRRKKHRPKVIREGKPKRTPKNPKNNSSNEIRVKRKYVRRKGVNNLDEKTTVERVKRKYVRKNGANKLESQQKSEEDDMETPPKSCKKQLNFDLENVVQNSSEQGMNINVKPQDIEQERIMLQQRMQGEKQQKLLAELNVPTRYHGLNMTTSPKQDRCDDGYNKVNEPVHEKGITKVVFKAGMGPIYQQGAPQSLTSEGMASLDERRGIKRQSYEQMGHNVNVMNSLLLYQKMLIGVANRAYDHNNVSNILFQNQKKMKVSEFQDNSRQMKGMYANRSAIGLLNSCTRRIDHPTCKTMNIAENIGNRQFLPPMVATYYLQKHQVLSGMQPHTMRSTPERSPNYTQDAIVSWNSPQPTTPKWASSYVSTAYPKLEKKQIVKPNGLNEILHQHRYNSINGYQQYPKMPRGRPRKQKVEVSVDDITHMLDGLHIYHGNKKQQSELVLYRGSEAIVPFQPIKKRNPRPKVDLDPETERLWNLLMGNEGNEGADTLDKDKEKWWENERQVFRGRADSFIARMHLVQGDRRFSRWKGSVVDSVIGVFLTQNVSDHLSSSAFISLAAKFPLRSTTAKKTCCQQPPTSQEENEIMNCHEKMASSEEQVNLTQDSFDSTIIQTVDELSSSSGSNSEAGDITTGLETSTQSGTPQNEESIMLKDRSCHANQKTLLDDMTTNMHHIANEPVCMQIPRMNTVNQNSSSSQFQIDMTLGLHTSNSGVTDPYHTSNLTCPQNEMPKLQTPLVDQYNLQNNHPSLLKTNQQVTEFFKETTINGKTLAKCNTNAPKQDSTLCEGMPMINVDGSISVVDKQHCFKNTVTEANSKEQNNSHEQSSGPGQFTPKARKETNEEKEIKDFDWDSLRKQALSKSKMEERSKDAMDSIDYEAVRQAHVNEISEAIKERGMNNLLADRIKDFLNRLVRDHGSIDLEWLRDAPPDKAKDYLLSFRGLGLKSVECVRLLTLHHLAFPVDTNVGRIAVRLGWVPLQPLPESLQLHLLEMYPVLESIQKYIWPRLCKLDQLTLYELHYQMITFGKVFCTKSKPNCNACPMRSECRHFASAFASARLALPGPEDKRIVTSDAPVRTDPIPPVVIRPMPLPPAENELNKSAEVSGRNCEPIIEEPTTPEPEANELSISDIEDQYYEDSDEIPSIKLNMEEFTTNLQNILHDSKELQDDMSKALVALNPNAASIPTPKLKDVSRLRTEHLVYELPDYHQLLEGLDKREPDDPSPYLLAIWTPGETANSVQPPKRDCKAQQSGQLCDQTTCFSCNCVKEANSQMVRGTILVRSFIAVTQDTCCN